MKHFFTFLLAFGFASLSLFGQTEYILTNNNTIAGITLINGGEIANSKFCQRKKGEKLIKYTPYEVMQYALKDGRVYLSKEIKISESTQRVFLECLTKGKLTLFYYRNESIKTYFLEKDGAFFIELPKKDRGNGGINFNSKLLDLTSDCPDVADGAKVISYNKKSLSRFISSYNYCEIAPSAYFKYGVIIGYESTKLSLPPTPQNIYDNMIASPDLEFYNYINQSDLKYDGGFTFGFFIDNPISFSNFSIHSELFYSKHSYSFNKNLNGVNLDFDASTSALTLPIMLRLTYPSNKIRPFVNAGINYSYNLKNENTLYGSTIGQSITERNLINAHPTISKSNIGYAIGSGVEYKLTHKMAMFFELRYTKLFGFNNQDSLNSSGIQLFTGVNF